MAQTWCVKFGLLVQYKAKHAKNGSNLGSGSKATGVWHI